MGRGWGVGGWASTPSPSSGRSSGRRPVAIHLCRPRTRANRPPQGLLAGARAGPSISTRGIASQTATLLRMPRPHRPLPTGHHRRDPHFGPDAWIEPVDARAGWNVDPRRARGRRPGRGEPSHPSGEGPPRQYPYGPGDEWSRSRQLGAHWSHPVPAAFCERVSARKKEAWFSWASPRATGETMPRATTVHTKSSSGPGHSPALSSRCTVLYTVMTRSETRASPSHRSRPNMRGHRLIPTCAKASGGGAIGEGGGGGLTSTHRDIGSNHNHSAGRGRGPGRQDNPSREWERVG